MKQEGALQLNYPSELFRLIESPVNSVVLFYAPGCKYCQEFSPTYEYFATNIHRTNHDENVVPIVMAKIDGRRWKESINLKHPGFFGDPINNRGYPTILFKSGDRVMTWPKEFERNEVNFSKFLSMFFQDESLEPVPDNLWETMNNPDAPFVLIYSDRNPIIPRFCDSLDPHFTSQSTGNEQIVYFFLQHPELHDQFMAIPTNRADRVDLSVPSIYDRESNKTHKLRGATRFLLNHFLVHQ